MDPLQQKLFAASGKQNHSGYTLGLPLRNSLMAAGEAYYKSVEKHIPAFKYEAYHSASGHSIKLRGRVRGSGLKFTILAEWNNQAQGNKLMARAVIMHLVRLTLDGALKPVYHSPGSPVAVPPQKQTEAENYARSAVVECVKEELLLTLGPGIQTILDGLQPDPSSVQKAQAGIVNNKQSSQNLRRKHALRKLADAMRGKDFTEEEVMEAWKMSLVEHVMES